MSNKIELNDPEAHEKLTAKVFIQLFGETGYRSLGNIVSYTHAQSRELRTRAESRDGARYVNDEQADVIHDAYEFTLDERNEFLERMINCARTSAAANQAAAVAATVSFSGVTPGLSYFIGKVGLSDVSVEVSAVTMTAGTDYTIDLNTGELVILEGGSISSGDDVDVTYTCADRGFIQMTGLDQAFFGGDIRFQEVNQRTREPLRLITGQANLNVTAFPEQGGEFGEYTVRLTWTNQPTITKRNESTALTADAESSS